MTNKNLLIITQVFPDKHDINYDGVFIKDQLKFLKKEFKNIYVIVPTPYVPNFIKKIPIFPKTWRDFCIRKNYNYDNIYVFFPKFFLLPFKLLKKNIDYTILKSIKKTIEINNIKFDIIHSHFSYPSGYLGAILKKMYKKPLVITVHEDANWLKKEIEDNRCLFSWKLADSIIRVNKKDINIFKNKGISMKKVLYIPNGFDHSLFKKIEKKRARKILGIPQNKKVILNIGKLDQRKNQKLAIEAVNVLKNKYKDIQLLILGEGPLKKELEDNIKNKGLEKIVYLVGGNKKREDIPIWINASDVFVLSSLSEGNPTVMFEVLGCNIPYIGSNVGGSSLIIKNKEIGLLFKPGNLSDLVKKLDTALSKKWNRDLIEKYSKKYSWEQICSKIKKIYRRLMK